MPRPERPVSAIVLAGGQSTRFGRDKALLSFGGRTLLAHTVDAVATLSDDVIVVTNRVAAYQELQLSARLVPDERPGEGSLMGIYSGLKVARHAHAFVAACDMPFLNLSLVAYMITLADENDVVVPRLGRLLEPLHAVYAKRCLQPIARLLDSGERQIIAFFPEVRVRYLDEDEIGTFDPLHLSFLNVNTPHDWSEAQRRLQSQKQSLAGRSEPGSIREF